MKKMMLVPSSYGLQPTSGVTTPMARKLSDLDRQMDEILKREDMDDYNKAQAYSRVLGRYMDLKGEAMKPTPIPIIDRSSSSSSSSSRSPTGSTSTSDTSIPEVDIEILPKPYRKKAEVLLKILRSTPNVSWNTRGEVIVDSRPIPGSHIVDLVGHVIRPAHMTKSPPPGSDAFSRVLKENNVPLTLVSQLKKSSPVRTPLSETPYRPKRKRKRPKRLVESSQWESYP